ncbi:hypothetical protein [Streptomyces sp. STR69]|nr:hypothetical protein [Streptomyces sp. STR69]
MRGNLAGPASIQEITSSYAFVGALHLVEPYARSTDASRVRGVGVVGGT